MKEVVEYIVKSLVKDKESVNVRQSEENGEIVLTVNVAPDDMGRVIGRHGKIALSIRAIVKSISSRENKKVYVRFGDQE